jgi:hypothetical protein
MPPEFPPAIGRLGTWVRSLGGRLTGFEIRTDADGGRGVHARSALKQGTALVEIPARCILTALNSEALAIALLTVRKSRAGYWRPYLDTLPKRYPSVPVFFRAADREFLKGSCTLGMIDAQKRKFAGEYRLLRGAFPGACPFTFREYLWARVTVITRGYALRGGSVPRPALVPAADLFDHHIPPDISYGYEGDAGFFRVTASRDVAPGAPVYASYGPSYNTLLFVNYGFACPENPHNEAYLPLPAMTVQQRVAALLNTLRASAGTPDGLFRLTVDVADSDGVLSFLRAACAGPEDQVRVTNCRVGPLGRRNEVRVLCALRQACLDALASFDGTLAEDDALLAAGGLTLNQRHAVTVRRGEKQVLHRYIDLADAVLPLLRLTGFEMAHIATAPPVSLSRFAPYLQTLSGLAAPS